MGHVRKRLKSRDLYTNEESYVHILYVNPGVDNWCQNFFTYLDSPGLTLQIY